MNFKSRSIAVFAALGLALTAEAGAQAGKTGVLKIGLNEALSGAMVAVGLPPAAAVRLAVKEINDKGGFVVAGTTYRIQLVEVDNQSQTANAVAGMTRLVEDEKIKFVFGPTLSTLATQTAAITIPAHVIQISAASSWQASGYLSDPAKPLLFGTQAPVTRIAEIDVAGLKQLGVKKVAFVSQDDDVTKSVLPSFTAAMKVAGIEMTTVLFPAGTSDFRPYVSRVKGEGADGIYFSYPHAAVNDLLRAAVELGAAPKAFGGRSLNPNSPMKDAIGKPVPIPFFATGAMPFFEYPSNARVKAFTERITAFEPRITGANASFAFFTYDFVPMLVEAMKKAGSVEDTAKVGAALAGLTYDGVVGKICFGKEVRTASLDGGLIFVRNGKIEATAFPSTCK